MWNFSAEQIRKTLQSEPMSITAQLAALVGHGIELAKEIFAHGTSLKSKEDLAAILGFDPTRVGRYQKTAKALFGPTDQPQLRAQAIAIAQKNNFSIDVLALINCKVGRLADAPLREEFRLELHRFAVDNGYTAIKQFANDQLEKRNGPNPARQHSLRYARFSHHPDANGMRYLITSLPDETMTAIEAKLVDKAKTRKSDTISMQQALADALSDALLGDFPMSQSSRPLREGLIMIPADGWRHVGDQWLVSTDGAKIHASELADHLLADFGYAIVYDEMAEPVDLYRTQRFANDKQRLILTADQLLCADPQCTRAAYRGQAHHIEAWKNGGDTNLNNLCLTCGPHNALNDDDHAKGKHKNGHYVRDKHNGRIGWQPPDPTKSIRFNNHVLAQKSARSWAIRHFEL